MTKAFSIAGAGTDVGKTYVSVALLQALRRRGVAVDALKPVVSGLDEETAQESDPARLLRAMGREATADEIARLSPLRFRASLSPPLAARLEGRALRYDEVAALTRARIAETGDALLLVETAGGVMSPLDDDSRTMLDLMAGIGGPAILVGGSYLGSISHILTALACLTARGVETVAIVVSESPGENPAFDETLAAVTKFAAPTPVIAAPRRPEGVWEADALADLLLAARGGARGSTSGAA